MADNSQSMCNVGKCPYTICEQWKSRWPHAFQQSDLDILCLATYTTVSIDTVSGQHITKTYLFKYTENFTTTHENFQIKILMFFMFLLKT